MDTGDSARIMRLEEELAFAQHSIDQLNTAMIDLGQRLERAMSRLGALEGRLGSLEAPKSQAQQGAEGVGDPGEGGLGEK